MTQGDPIYPTIFNVVVDAVMCHWVSVIVEGAEERGKRGKEGRNQNALFYADYGMVASLDPQRIQGSFSTLVSLFDRVGLQTNVGNKLVMVCCPCQAAGIQLRVAYMRRMTGEGPSYKDRQRRRVQ